MGTSLLGWVQELLERDLFAADARVFGLTSEGNAVAWKGYAAVAAAKVALESVSRSIAVEFAPYGVRCNVVQAGVTETPALAAIPGSATSRRRPALRNPSAAHHAADVANVIYLSASPEAGWINGEVIRVDGGEQISGASSEPPPPRSRVISIPRSRSPIDSWKSSTSARATSGSRSGWVSRLAVP